jgi:hypothetical protein
MSQTATRIENPQPRVGDEIVHSFWTLDAGVITRIGTVTRMHEVAGRPYCIYTDSVLNQPCGFYLDGEVAVTIL